MEMNGEILCAHCTCMAGLGEACTHIAACLFFIEAKVRITGQSTCTSQSCQWNIPAFQKEIPYLPIKDIDFSSAESKLDHNAQSSTATAPTSSTANLYKVVPPSSEHMNIFIDQLSKCGTRPAILSVHPKYSGKYIPKVRTGTLPRPLQSLYDRKCLSLNYEELLSVCDTINIHITNDMAKAVQQATVKQSASKLWYKFRAGRVTASRMKQVCHTSLSKPSQSLIKTICYPEAFRFTTKATQWGCKHEAAACKHYKFVQLQDKKHHDFSVEPSGLVINPDWPHLGASPDGIVDCSCCGKGTLEIKCPFCDGNESIETSLSNTKTCLSNVDGSMHLNTTHQYYYQVQTQLFVCKASYCDFCVCTFPESGPSMHIERIYPDNDFWKNCIEKTTNFFKLCVLPELVGKWYTKPSNLKPAADVSPTDLGTESEPLYCYCRRPEPKEGSSSSCMIGCDNPNCPIQWFHTSCIKLKSVPKDKWYCPECRKLPEFSTKKRKVEE